MSNKKNNDDNSLSDNHPLMLFAKAKSWIKLFLFPVALAVLASGIIISNSSYRWDDALIVIILIVGGLLGMVFATRMGNKHGLIEIDARLMETPDIDEDIKNKKTE
jgi:hypothetical protein